MNPIAYAQIEQSAKYIEGIKLSLSSKNAMEETCGMGNQLQPRLNLASMLEGKIDLASFRGSVVLTSSETKATATTGFNEQLVTAGKGFEIN